MEDKDVALNRGIPKIGATMCRGLTRIALFGQNEEKDMVLWTHKRCQKAPAMFPRHSM